MQHLVSVSELRPLSTLRRGQGQTCTKQETTLSQHCDDYSPGEAATVKRRHGEED